MQISDFVQQYNNNLAAGSDIATGTKGIEQISKTVQTLQSGQVFEGSVSNVTGDRVTISLSSGQSISARLDSGVSLSLGQSLFFEVKNTDGNTIQIRPMLGNDFTNPTLLKALDSAGLPVNEKSLNLVNNLMNESMPIDAKSLSQMARSVMTFPMEDIQSLVQMQKLNIPLNQEMLTQFSNYKANESALVDSMADFANELPELFQGASFSASDLIHFQEQFVKLVQFGDLSVESDPVILNSNEGVTDTMQNAVEVVPDKTSENINQQFANEVNQNSEINTINDVLNKADALALSSGEQNISIVASEADSLFSSEADSLLVSELESGNGKALNIQITTPDEDLASLPNRGSLNELLSRNEMQELNQLISKLPTETLKNLNLLDHNGSLRSDLSSTEFINKFTESLQSSELQKKDLIQLLSQDCYKKVFKNFLMNQWSIKPNDLNQKDILPKLYEKLEVQMKQIEEMAKSISKTDDNPISKTANNIRSNIDFMNQLNQSYTYVQIPLRMQNQNATGDLYVYSNKNRKFEEDEKITAFLHFDLEHLGGTDVSIEMIHRDVDANFYLDSDASYQLIEQNLPILASRLEKKGYHCNFTVAPGTALDQKEKADFVSQVIRNDFKDAGVLQHYSFDVRA